MKRELKFRVWTGNGMEYNITVGKFGTFYVNPENGDGLNPKDTASLTTCTTKYSDDVPVMQFTGLKDKNGKDIYEGDVLITYNEHLADKKDILAVKYSGSSFVIYNPKCCKVCKEGFGCIGNLDEFEVSDRVYEVIGNIYESPDLLK